MSNLCSKSQTVLNVPGVYGSECKCDRKHGHSGPHRYKTYVAERPVIAKWTDGPAAKLKVVFGAVGETLNDIL